MEVAVILIRTEDEAEERSMEPTLLLEDSGLEEELPVTNNIEVNFIIQTEEIKGCVKNATLI